MSLPEGFPWSVPSGHNTQWRNTEFWGNTSASADASRLINSYVLFLGRIIFPLCFNLCSPEHAAQDTHLNVSRPRSWAVENSHWLHQTAPLSHSSPSGKPQTDRRPLRSRNKNMNQRFPAVPDSPFSIRGMLCRHNGAHQTAATRWCSRSRSAWWCSSEESLETAPPLQILHTVLRTELHRKQIVVWFILKLIDKRG